MKRFAFKRVFVLCCIVGVCFVSTNSFAAAFQLWEQDGATLGNVHAGYAVLENNASSSFYNPAALTTLKKPQLIVGGVNVFSHFKFTGLVNINTIDPAIWYPVSAQGGGYGFLPVFHYAEPLNDTLFFGFSVDVPFGLKTNYGKTSPLQYVTTKMAIDVVDVSPVWAVKVTDKLSIGAGPDLQIAHGEFDQVGVLGTDLLSSDGINKADGTAYGYHAGVFYQITSQTDAGLSYHSQVVHHLTGTSELSGELVDTLAGFGLFIPPSTRAKVNLTLPPYTAVSFSHHVNSQVTLLTSVIYTQWNTIQNLVLQNVSGIDSNNQGSNEIMVTIPQHFRNTLSYSAGLNYQLTEKIMLRGGVGYDETPVRDEYRNAQLPDNNRYLLGAGLHYQLTPAVGVDAGWMHLFIVRAVVHPPTQVTGGENTNVTGHVTGHADVLGLQFVWDIN